MDIFSYDEAIRNSTVYFKGDALAAEVFVTKYALKDKFGTLLEDTPDKMHMRLARELARIENKYPNPLSEKEIFDFLDGFKRGVAQGSPMAGIGNPYQIMSISNCFTVAPPEDSYSGICFTDQEEAQIMKRRGGVGSDISTLRPKGMSTANAAGTTDGIGVFMERFSNTCREVAQNGRRGALMLTISIHHPEIETFINIKKDLSKVTGANISIRLTDEFLNAVKNNQEYEQRWPVDSKTPKVSKQVSAKYIWDQIVDSAWTSAEPGLLFWDTVQRETPTECYTDFKSTSTNPCLTDDTWIMTKYGPRQIHELLNKNFVAIVDGKNYNATKFYKTGEKEVYKLKTSKGYEINATSNHKILTENRGWVELGSLNTEDKIIVNKHEELSWGGEGTFDEGWLVGEMVGDGCYNPERYYGQVCFWGRNKEYMADLASKRVSSLSYNFRSDFNGGKAWLDKYDKISVISRALDKLSERYISKKDKSILPELEKSSSEFCKGFLRGFFDADGSVQGNLTKGVSIRLAQNNIERLKVAQRILLRFGIVSTIYENRKKEGFYLLPDNKGTKENKEYFCKSMYELCISKNMIDKFEQLIGFEDPDKKLKLANISSDKKRDSYKTSYTTKFVSVEKIGVKSVYDCTVSDVHRFDANGIMVHNCSEITLSNYDSCRLFLINVFGYVQNPFNKTSKFNWDLYNKDVCIAQRLMDDIVDLEVESIDKIIAKVESDPEPEHIKFVELNLWKKIKNACVNGRRTGLGITGLGDTIAALGLTYGSDSSIGFTENIYKELAFGAYKSSVQMAKERGPFPAFDYELEKNHPFIKKIVELDETLTNDWKKYGRRNIALTTTAPAGSVSILTQTTSGIEPAFLVSYKRRKKINPIDKNPKVDFIDDMGDRWQEFTVFHHGYKMWMDVNGKTNDDFSKSPYCKATSKDVDWESSVKLQGSAQKWVCHAISKTCNLPNDASKELVSKIYLRAWEEGCKGFTIYRDGCRSGVLVSDTKDKAVVDENSFVEHHAPKRPRELDCDIYHFSVKGEKWSAFVGMYQDKPYEIFAGRAEFVDIPKSKKHGKIFKNGKYNLIIGNGDDQITVKDLATIFENPTESSFTRTVSLALRHGTPVQYLVEQLEKGADRDSDMFSLAKGIMRVLKSYIKDGTKIGSNKKCSQCQMEDSLIYQEGCLTCKGCGFSKCG